MIERPAAGVSLRAAEKLSHPRAAAPLRLRWFGRLVRMPAGRLPQGGLGEDPGLGSCEGRMTRQPSISSVYDAAAECVGAVLFMSEDGGRKRDLCPCHPKRTPPVVHKKKQMSLN